VLKLGGASHPLLGRWVSAWPAWRGFEMDGGVASAATNHSRASARGLFGARPRQVQHLMDRWPANRDQKIGPPVAAGRSLRTQMAPSRSGCISIGQLLERRGPFPDLHAWCRASTTGVRWPVDSSMSSGCPPAARSAALRVDCGAGQDSPRKNHVLPQKGGAPIMVGTRRRR